MRSRHVLLCALAVASFGCGGRSPTGPSEAVTSSASSSTPPLPSPTPAPVPAFRVQFNFDEVISAPDRQIAEAAVPIAQEYFSATFAKQIQGAITVNVKASDCVISAGNSIVQVCTLNEGWAGTSDVRKAKILGHELFHILQQQNGWPGSDGGALYSANWWRVEGSAEYVGYAMTIAKGTVSYERVRSCQTGNYVRGNLSTPFPPLDQIGRDTPGVKVVFVWLAWDHLLNGLTGASKISGGLSGLPFEAAYGKSPEQFVQEFEQYRRTLSDPRILCGY